MKSLIGTIGIFALISVPTLAITFLLSTPKWKIDYHYTGSSKNAFTPLIIDGKIIENGNNYVIGDTLMGMTLGGDSTRYIYTQINDSIYSYIAYRKCVIPQQF